MPDYVRLKFTTFVCLLAFTLLSPDGEASSDNSSYESYASIVSANNIDIDGNEKLDALTDGLLILRSMFGLTGDSLISGVVGEDARYEDAQEIEVRIASLGVRIDIDDNGRIDALTDGLIILRYLFGLSGDTLINGVVAADATRTSAEEIEAHLEALMPSL